MLRVHALVFDDIITGAGTVCYSQPQAQARLGAADAFAIHACTSYVSGTASLTVQAEHSADSKNWVPTSSPEISVGIGNDNSYVGYQNPNGITLLAFLRFKITLTGTNPQCRLKLYCTGRVRAPHAVPPGATAEVTPPVMMR